MQSYFMPSYSAGTKNPWVAYYDAASATLSFGSSWAFSASEMYARY